jgi:hypothetical protein
MKNLLKTLIFFIFICLFVMGAFLHPFVQAQTETPVTETSTTEAPTETPTGTATTNPTATEVRTPTATLEPTEAPPTPFARPLVVIDSYDTGTDAINPGSDFTLKLRLKNNGGSGAYNLVGTFESSDFLPLESGGVRAVSALGSGSKIEVSQPMRANAALWGLASGTVMVNLNYTDSLGTAYTEKFTLTINLKQPNYSSAATATATLQPRAQMVVGGYSVDVDPLQPGSIFNLSVQVRNLGSVDASNVTMVLGGGVNTGSGSEGNNGTTTGGLSGGSSDLSVFAPLGTSNLIFIEHIPVDQLTSADAQLIVNVSAAPGAYPFKISFVYNDEEGERVVDDQVITLLVYSLPRIEIGFYRDPGVLFAGQPAPLPLQVTNLGKTTAVLGNLKITSNGADITENVALVGPLEPGGYFTLDAMAMPISSGMLDLNATISYSDDFNQPRTIEQTLQVSVEDAPVFEPMPNEGMNGMPGGTTEILPETFGQKILRFLKGLLGLGSAKPENEDIYPVPVEGEQISPEQIKPVVPLPGGKG